MSHSARHHTLARSLRIAARAAAANGTTTPTAAPLSSNGTASAAAKSTVDPLELVYHIDLLLIAFVAVLVLFCLPRLAARFSHRPAWRALPILRRAAPASGASSDPAHEQPRWEDPFADDKSVSRSPSSVDPFGDDKASPESYMSHAHILPRLENAATSASAPWHMPSWSALLHPVSTVIHAPIAPGTTIGQLLLLLCYLGALVYPVLYKTNPFTDPKRLGVVAVSQLPVLVALAIKNNPASTLIGVSYEKVRFCARTRYSLALTHYSAR
jgi:ferric-chelate reductase